MLSTKLLTDQLIKPKVANGVSRRKTPIELRNLTKIGFENIFVLST